MSNKSGNEYLVEIHKRYLTSSKEQKKFLIDAELLRKVKFLKFFIIQLAELCVS